MQNVTAYKISVFDANKEVKHFDYFKMQYFKKMHLLARVKQPDDRSECECPRETGGARQSTHLCRKQLGSSPAARVHWSVRLGVSSAGGEGCKSVFLLLAPRTALPPGVSWHIRPQCFPEAPLQS